MSNIFKNTRFMMGLSIVCGIASLVLGGISLYYKEYIIGGALIFNIFICFINYKGWQKKGYVKFVWDSRPGFTVEHSFPST